LQAWLVVNNCHIDQSNKVPHKSIQLFSYKHLSDSDSCTQSNYEQTRWGTAVSRNMANLQTIW